ncbi:MAG: hypothetical protein ACLFQ8_01320 [Candidatus Aenigmatarchaeota archaeon]
MLLFVIAIVMFLLSGVLYAGVMEPIFAAFAGFDTMDRACNKFCSIQTDVEGLSGWNIIGIGDDQWWGRKTTFEVALDKLKQNIDPKAMGCYCGVSERSGKYIHIHGNADDGTVKEFHITDQNPKLHLQYYANKKAAAEFDHADGNRQTDGLENCKDEMEDSDEFTGLEDLGEYEGCVIVSMKDGSESCTIYGAQEGSALWNKEGESLSSMIHLKPNSRRLTSGTDNNPLQLEIGQQVEVKGDKPAFQKILLRQYWEGERPFDLYAPVVCKSESVEQDPETEFDKACAEYCSEEDMGFWQSKCSDTALRDYDELPEKYTKEEDFCPDEFESPYCQCVVEKEYYWQVDEEYEPKDE